MSMTKRNARFEKQVTVCSVSGCLDFRLSQINLSWEDAADANAMHKKIKRTGTRYCILSPFFDLSVVKRER